MCERIAVASASICRRLAVVGFLMVLGAALLAPRLDAQDKFDWMPAESVGEASRGQDLGGEQIIPEIIITSTPKPTADMSKFTKEYVIELDKFNISNTATNPVETSKGINLALQHAKELKANRIVFPKGTYLLSELDPIILDHKDTIVDLNGSTLQARTNGTPVYSLVQIVDGAENFRLTNGVIRGDRDTHDMTTIKGSHEACRLLILHGGKNLELDHITFSKSVGTCIHSASSGARTRLELLEKIMDSVLVGSLEKGAFSKEGEKTPSAEKMRTIKPYDATKCNGEFEFGCGNIGYQGYPHIKGRVYQVYFYDKDMKFLEMAKVLQYKKITVPKDAKFMNLEFNQSAVEGAADVAVGRITNFRPPTDVHFHDNLIIESRTLGYGFGGGQKWLFENNVFEKNGPDVVGWGFDFEDGWELMQDVVLRNNIFRGNLKGDLVICAGTELLFEGNTFTGNVAMHGRPHNYIFRNNKFTGGHIGYTTRTGVARIENNTYENCSIGIVFDTKAVADGLYRKPGETVATPPLTLENETLTNVSKVTGTYFNFINSTMKNVNFVAGKETGLVNLKNCDITGSSILFEAEGPQVLVKMDGNKGALTQSGPGLKRVKMAP